MSKSEKLIVRFKSFPNDFTFDEAEKMLSGFGYIVFNKGKTSGSRVMFIRNSDKNKIIIHKPHNPSVFKKYALTQLYEKLIENGDIKEG